MNAIRAVWSERTNILYFLNTVAIALVAYVLWVKIPLASQSQTYSSELSAQSESIDKLTARLDHPLNVTVSNETRGLNGMLETTVPFTVDIGGKVDATVEGKGGLADPDKVDAKVEGKVNTNVEEGSLFNPIHISNP